MNDYLRQALWPFPTKERPLHARLLRSLGKRLLELRRGKMRPPTEKELAPDRARYELEARNYFQAPGRASLQQYIDQSTSSGAQQTDYFLLHQYILKRRPARVLELGSGRTSIIMAHAMSEAGPHPSTAVPGHVESMEHLENYHRDIKKICPPPLQPFVTFRLSPATEVVWRQTILTSAYVAVPQGPYDLVFVDGPPANGLCNGDVLQLLEAGEESFDMIIDRRRVTCNSLVRLFPPGMIAYDHVLDVGLARGVHKRALLKKPNLPSRLPEVDAFEFLGLR